MAEFLVRFASIPFAAPFVTTLAALAILAAPSVESAEESELRVPDLVIEGEDTIIVLPPPGIRAEGSRTPSLELHPEDPVEDQGSALSDTSLVTTVDIVPAPAAVSNPEAPVREAAFDGGSGSRIASVGDRGVQAPSGLPGSPGNDPPGSVTETSSAFAYSPQSLLEASLRRHSAGSRWETEIAIEGSVTDGWIGTAPGDTTGVGLIHASNRPASTDIVLRSGFFQGSHDGDAQSDLSAKESLYFASGSLRNRFLGNALVLSNRLQAEAYHSFTSSTEQTVQESMGGMVGTVRFELFGTRMSAAADAQFGISGYLPDTRSELGGRVAVAAESPRLVPGLLVGAGSSMVHHEGIDCIYPHAGITCVYPEIVLRYIGLRNVTLGGSLGSFFENPDWTEQLVIDWLTVPSAIGPQYGFDATVAAAIDMVTGAVSVTFSYVDGQLYQFDLEELSVENRRLLRLAVLIDWSPLSSVSLSLDAIGNIALDAEEGFIAPHVTAKAILSPISLPFALELSGGWSGAPLIGIDRYPIPELNVSPGASIAAGLHWPIPRAAAASEAEDRSGAAVIRDWLWRYLGRRTAPEKSREAEVRLFLPVEGSALTLRVSATAHLTGYQ